MYLLLEFERSCVYYPNKFTYLNTPVIELAHSSGLTVVRGQSYTYKCFGFSILYVETFALFVAICVVWCTGEFNLQEISLDQEEFSCNIFAGYLLKEGNCIII